MQLQVGMVTEGKVTGITKFRAFVALPEGKSGLVHISEIANTFVNDVRDYVRTGKPSGEGHGISPDGRSISPSKGRRAARPERAGRRASVSSSSQAARTARVESLCREPTAPTGDAGFEDKLKQFTPESDSRMADNKMYSDHRTSRRRRRAGLQKGSPEGSLFGYNVHFSTCDRRLQNGVATGPTFASPPPACSSITTKAYGWAVSFRKPVIQAWLVPSPTSAVRSWPRRSDRRGPGTVDVLDVVIHHFGDLPGSLGGKDFVSLSQESVAQQESARRPNRRSAMAET